jgi:hypothetical protein
LYHYRADCSGSIAPRKGTNDSGSCSEKGNVMCRLSGLMRANAIAKRLRLVFVAGVTLGAAFTVLAQVPSYTLIDLGTLGGGKQL